MILQIQYKELADQFFLIYNFIYSFIYLFLAMLGLPCCGDFSLVVVSGCYSLVVVRGLLIAVASLVAEHGLQGSWASVVAAWGLSICGSWALEHRLNICGTWAQLLHGMWNLPGSGIKSVSSSLAGGIFTTKPPGKPARLTNGNIKSILLKTSSQVQAPPINHTFMAEGQPIPIYSTSESLPILEVPVSQNFI